MGAKAFQLIMGYRELFILFGVLIILFILLLSFGYSIGQDKAEITPPSQQPALVAPTEPSQQEQPLPAAPPAIRLKAVPSGPDSGDQIHGNRKSDEQAESKPAPKPVSTEKPAAKPTVKKTAAVLPAAPAPVSPSKPKPVVKPAPQPLNGSVSSGAIQLQVAALRNGAAAETLTGQLRAKGHAAAVLQDAQDGWYRVCVGAFSDAESAKAYQRRLSEEGLASFLRRR